jgi:hypothetical protein
MMRYLVVAALLVLGLTSDQLAAAQDRLPPALRVGMDTRAPPWSYVPGLDYAQEDPARDPVLTEAELQKVEGLDVDVARALGRRLGLPVKIVPVSWFDIDPIDQSPRAPSLRRPGEAVRGFESGQARRGGLRLALRSMAGLTGEVAAYVGGASEQAGLPRPASEGKCPSAHAHPSRREGPRRLGRRRANPNEVGRSELTRFYLLPSASG